LAERSSDLHENFVVIYFDVSIKCVGS